MSTLSDTMRITCTRVQADGTIEIDRIRLFMEGEKVVGRGEVSTQVLQPGQDLASLEIEPQILAIAVATWSPETVQGRTAALLAVMDEEASKLLVREKEHVAALESEKQHHATLRADIDASRQALERGAQAIVAAHRELDAEHATLAQRQEQVTSARVSLFAQHEVIRKQRPELDALLTAKLAEVAAPPSPSLPGAQGAARG